MHPLSRFVVTATASIAGLTACTTNVVEPARSERATRELDRRLEGRIAGEPQRCISSDRARDMAVIDSNTVLFRESGRRIWRTAMQGGCSGLGSVGRALVTTRSSGQLCRGDIGRLVDTSTRMMVGTCSFGDFIPYTRPNGG